jgi:hypothetical protein
MHTQILVIDRDKKYALDLLDKLKKVCEEFNQDGRVDPDTHRITVNPDMAFDVVLVKYDGKWDVESIRSSEKALKWLYKESRGITC